MRIDITKYFRNVVQNTLHHNFGHFNHWFLFSRFFLIWKIVICRSKLKSTDGSSGKPPGGWVFFFFTFKMRLAQKKKKNPPDVFSIFSKYFSKTKFWGWVFFSFEKHQFFEDSSKKTPPLGVFPRNHCTRFPICRFFSDSEIYPFFITNNEKSENDV